jgi:hypothetical protein
MDRTHAWIWPDLDRFPGQARTKSQRDQPTNLDATQPFSTLMKHHRRINQLFGATKENTAIPTSSNSVLSRTWPTVSPLQQQHQQES